MTSTVIPGLRSFARFGQGQSFRRAVPAPASGWAGLISLAAPLTHRWAAHERRAQARSLMQRAKQFEATQPSYAADLRAAARAVRQAGSQDA